MMCLNTGVICMSLLVVAICATTPALGLKYLQKRQGLPAMQRRRLRKHNKEVVQVPKGERRKGSNKNSYKPDERDYPAYLSGFFGYGGQATEDPKESTYSEYAEYVLATYEPTYSPTYGYDETQPGDGYYGSDNDNGYYGPYPQDYYYVDPNREYYYPNEYQDGSHAEAYNHEDGHYEQPPGSQYQGQVEQYMESEPQPQPQPQPNYPEVDGYPADEAVYSYNGGEKKHATKGTTEGKTGTKEGKKGAKDGKNVGKKIGNKGLTTKYAEVKSYTSKGKKGNYYEYTVEEEALQGGTHGEVIYDEQDYPGEGNNSEYDLLHGQIHDGLIDPFPDNVHQELHEVILEQTRNPSAKAPVPEEYYYPPPKGSKSQKGSTIPGEVPYPVVKGPKGEQLHSRSKSSSCSKGKGKGKGGDGLSGKKKSKSRQYYYYTELLDTESWVTDECTSDSTKTSTKKSSGSGKKSKSQGKSMIEYPPYTSFPTFDPSFGGNGTAPIPFGELTAVPSDVGLIPVEDGETNTPADEPAASPTVPASLSPTMLINVDFLSFGLLYDIDRSEIPPDEDYAAAAVISGMCVSNYFGIVYNPDADSIFISSELVPGSIAYSLLSGAISDYTGSAMFSDAGDIPTPEALDMALDEAFVGGALIECMNLFVAELPPENLFSTVTNIRKVDPSTTMPNGRRRRYSTSSFSLQQGIFMVTAFGMVGILVYMGARMWLGSRRKRQVATKGGAYFGGDDIIMGENFNGYLVER